MKYHKSSNKLEKEIERAKQVVELRESGMVWKDIAKQLWISQPTAYTDYKKYSNWEWIDKLNSIKDKPNYEIDWDDIVFWINTKNNVWDSIKEKISIPVYKVWDISYDYTYGKMSWPKVIKKHRITPKAFQLIKSRFNLYKDSNALPDVVLDFIEEKYWEDAVEEKIIEVSHKAAVDKYRNRFTKAYEKSQERLDDKVRKSFANLENFLELLDEHLLNYKPRVLKLPKIKLKNNDELTVCISDLHIGKGWTDEVLNRLNKIAFDCVKAPESKINIICWWDLAENLSPVPMHFWQAEGMEMHWFDLMMYTVHTLEEFIIEIAKKKKVTFYWIVGNHDRVSSWNDQDHQRLWGLCIYEMIKRWLQWSEIKFKYMRDKWNRFIIDGYGYILNHWDCAATNKKTADIVMTQGVQTEHTIVLMWDKHHLEMKDESLWVMRILMPALAWAWEYDTRLWLSSYPWYIQIKKWWDGYPITSIIRLK